MGIDTIISAEQELASEAIGLQAEMNALKIKLDEKKIALRSLANEQKKEIVVEGVGKINISAPFAGKETAILVFNEEVLEKLPEFRAKLIKKGVAEEKIKKTAATSAKVTIKPNV